MTPDRPPLPPPTPPVFRSGQRVRHVKTDRVYQVIFGPEHVRIEKTLEPAYFYAADGIPEGTAFWVRPQVEMEDGRFVAEP